MTSSHRPKRPEPSQSSPAAANPDAAAAGLSAPLLEQVMSETVAQLAEPEQLDPALHDKLVEVARRFAGQPLLLETTGVALLEALLAADFGLFEGRPALLTNTAREVARLLLADPGSHGRLERLWQTLSEEAA